VANSKAKEFTLPCLAPGAATMSLGKNAAERKGGLGAVAGRVILAEMSAARKQKGVPKFATA
jgi:hypothetical protein